MQEPMSAEFPIQVVPHVPWHARLRVYESMYRENEKKDPGLLAKQVDSQAADPWQKKTKEWLTLHTTVTKSVQQTRKKTAGIGRCLSQLTWVPLPQELEQVPKPLQLFHEYGVPEDNPRTSSYGMHHVVVSKVVVNDIMTTGERVSQLLATAYVQNKSAK